MRKTEHQEDSTHARDTDESILAWAREVGMGPKFYEGFAEGVRQREAFRAKHGRLPNLGEC